MTNTSQLDSLAASGWVGSTSVPGLLSYTTKFESVAHKLQAVLTAADPAGSAGPSWYASVMPRADIDRAEYGVSFPQLLGSVHALRLAPAAGEAAVGDASAGVLAESDVVLAPTLCYHIYPQLAGQRIDRTHHFDLAGQCYRHEATSEYGRFRSFRIREFVAIGGPVPAREWRDGWIERGEKLFDRLGLKVRVEQASDPFFGPGERFKRASQLQRALKYEFVAPVYDGDAGTALASANCHTDHLCGRFAIDLRDGGRAHSSCVGFGVERIVSALIHAHGRNLEDWPELA
jgi:seryl-tRNA synthetase